MSLKISGFGRKLQQILLQGFGLFPAAVLLVMMLRQEALLPLAGMPAAYVLLALGCLALPGRIRLAGGLAAVAALMGVAYGLLPMEAEPAFWLIPAAYAASLIWSLQLNNKHMELPAAAIILGVIFYVLVQICLLPAQRRGEPHVGTVTLLLTVGFLIFATAAVLSFNRGSMDTAAHYQGGTPRSMRRMNTTLTLMMLGGGVALAALPAVGQLVATAWQWLIQVLSRLAEFLMSLMPEQQTTTGGGSLDMGGLGMMMGEVTEPSLLSRILEKILLVVAIVLLALGILWLGKNMARVLWRAMRYLWQRLTRMAMAISEDYEDEITDTREEGERSTAREALNDWLHWRDERRMTPSQRVRYRYKRQRIKHPQWRGASTARENLPLSAAEIYERVRYGGLEATPEEADQFAKQVEKGAVD